MPSVSPELVNKFTGLQQQIWQTVSLTTSEACNAGVNFGSPLTTVSRITDLYADVSAPMLVLQFAFANLPENPHVILLPQDTFAQFAGMLRGEPVTDIDENVLSEARAAVEAIVQGVCMAVGNVKNEAVVASGLSVRYQIFSFPPNLQRLEEMIRVQVAVQADDVAGAAIWLLDPETAGYITGMDAAVAEDASGPFAAMAPGMFEQMGSHTEDANGLDLLLDIPLEVSVELGRVKMLIRDVLELGTGSIIEIDKAAGEPVDVMVNGRLVAKGEVVVIEDNFGVRITEIVTPQERLRHLGDAA